MSSQVQFTLALLSTIDLNRSCSLSSCFLATNASEFLNEESCVRSRSHWPYFQRLSCGLSSRFLATNTSEFLNEESCLRSRLQDVGLPLRSFTLFFWEMATESIMKRVARINFQVIYFFFYKCTLTCYRKLLTENCSKMH